MDIVFVRHGKTGLNDTNRYCGITDCELSDDGVREIQNLKEYIKAVDFDCVYTSPLKRTIQTARILEKDFIKECRVREMDFGKFEGLTYSEVCEKYPLEAKEWDDNFLNYKLPGGENLLGVYDRTKKFIEDVSSKHNRILVITHGGIIRCALSFAFGSPEYFFRFKVECGTTSIISINNGYAYIKGVNCGGNLMEVLK